MHPLGYTLLKKTFVIKYTSERRCIFVASKGQKFNKYSDKLKLEIINKYFDGKGSTRSLGKEYVISYKTIDNMIYRYKHPELTTGKKCGHPKERNLTKEDYKERYEILKKYQAFLKAQRERK